MGWNFFYKECKYIAAHRLLKSLDKRKELGVSRTFYIEDTKKDMRFFSLQMINDTAFMLSKEKEVKYFTGGGLARNAVAIDTAGGVAFREKKYIRKFFGSAKTIIVMLIAAIALSIPWLQKLQQVLKK